MRNILVFLFLMGFFPCFTLGQDNFADKFSSPDEAKNHLKYFKNFAKNNLKLDDKKINFCYKYQINITKKSQFDEIGVDILPRLSGQYKTRLDYRKALMIAPVIIEGVIIKKSYLTNPKSVLHSEYLIQVTETIFNENNEDFEFIKVKQYAGLTHEGNFVSNTLSDKHFIGEKVILFLQPLSYSKDIEVIQKSIHTPEEKEDYLKTRYNTDNTDLPYCFLNLNKLSEKSGYLFIGNKKIGKKEEILSVIRSFVEINNRKDFFKIHNNH